MSTSDMATLAGSAHIEDRELNDVASPQESCNRRKQLTVAVVIPCLNEERTIAQCVHTAIAAIDRLGLVGEVIVSDNGSTDDSVRIAAAAGANVVHCRAKGYGNAIIYGVRQARAEILLMGDADGSHDFSHLDRFVRPLQEGAEFVIGNRFKGGIRPGAMSWKNRYIGNPVLTGVLNLFFHTHVGDAHCGLRSFTRSAFDRMRLECGGMEFASEMIVKAAKLRLRIVEVPTTQDPDGRGRPPHLRPWRDGWRHLKFLLMFSPLHLFLIPAVVMFLLGLVFLLLPAGGLVHIAGMHFGIHWMIVGALLLLVGTQVGQFGVLARMYMINHRFPERDPVLEWMKRRLRVEYGLLLGVILSLAGFGIDTWLVARWIWSQSGPFSEVRPMLIATSLMAVGVQTTFFAFLLSILNPTAIPDREMNQA